MVPLLSILYMKPLLMLLEGEFFIYTNGGLFSDVEVKLSSTEAGITSVQHCKSEQRSTAYAQFLKERLLACLR